MMENSRPLMKNKDVLLILFAKLVRMFSYGMLSVPMVLHLQGIGLNNHKIGVLMTLVLIGNFIVNWIITSRADRLGRKNALLYCSFMKFITGFIYALFNNFYVLAIVGMIGIIPMNGGETGAFFPIEQAVLSDTVEIKNIQQTDKKIVQSDIAKMMGWYNMFGLWGFALGCGVVGYSIKFLRYTGLSETGAYRIIFLAYSICGFIIFVLYFFVSSSVQALPSTQVQIQSNIQTQRVFNLSLYPSLFGFDSMRTLKIIFALGIFMVFDAFAGGLTPNSYYSLWFTKQWNASPQLIGLVLMACSIISGVGGFLASQSVKYIGIIAVMIGSHLPSNLFLILIPLMPTLQLAIIMTILKSFTTNMNLSCRQTYIMQLVKSDQKSAANGIISMSRTLGTIFSPIPLTNFMNGTPKSTQFNMPFYLNGGIRFILDFVLLVFYMNVKGDKHLHKKQIKQYAKGQVDIILSDDQQEQKLIPQNNSHK